METKKNNNLKKSVLFGSALVGVGAIGAVHNQSVSASADTTPATSQSQQKSNTEKDTDTSNSVSANHDNAQTNNATSSSSTSSSSSSSNSTSSDDEQLTNRDGDSSNNASQQAADAQKQAAEAQAQAKQAQADKEAAQNALNQAQAEIQTLKQQQAELSSSDQQKLAQLEQDKANAQSQLDQANSKITDLSNTISTISQKLNDLQAKLDKQTHDDNLTAQVQTKEVTVSVGSTYNPQQSFVSATNSDGQQLSLSDFQVDNPVVTTPGTRPQDYTVSFSYHKTRVNTVVHVVNNSAMTLRRNDSDHPYFAYAGDQFNQLSLITSLKDDAGNDVDSSTALNDKRLVLTQDGTDFPGGPTNGYWLTFSYHPDGPTVSPTFRGRVKVYTINNSSLVSHAINLTVGDSYTPANSVDKLTDAHGNTDTFDNAIKNGSLKLSGDTNIDSSKPGSYKIVYTYYGNSYTANVNVLDKSDLGLNNDANLKAGDTFTPQSAVSIITDVKGNPVAYDDAVKSGELVISGLDKLNTNVPGIYKVTYRYAGKDHVYTVRVNTQKSVEFTQNPTAIFIGTAINTSSYQQQLFKAFTDDLGKPISYQQAVANGLQIDMSKVDNTKVGTYYAVVTYGDKQYPLEIQVQQAPSFVINNNGGTQSSSNVGNGSKEAVIGKKVSIYVPQSAKVYQAADTTKLVGQLGSKKTGFKKIKAQLVKKDGVYFYKIAKGKYVLASGNNSSIIDANLKRVQTTRSGVKAYSRVGAKKAAKTLSLGTVIYIKSTIVKNNQVYFKVVSHHKTYYIKAHNNNLTNTIGMVKGMKLYLYGHFNVYKDAKLKHRALTVKKNHKKIVKFESFVGNKTNVWKVTGGYVHGSALLKASKVYNDIFG